MRHITVSPEENRLLHNHADHSQLILVRKKANAILMATEGVETRIIAGVLGREESTVCEWLGQWKKTRMGSVATGHAGNLNASKLTQAQRAQVRRDLGVPPEAHGLPAGFWDVPKLKRHIDTTFDVVYESDQSYHYLLRMSGLDLKYPDKLDRRRDDRAVEERMDQIRVEIAPLLADPECEVFAADEVRLDQEAITRRAWLPVGKPTILKVDRQVQAQSYLGLLNQATGQCELFPLAWQKTSEILTALEQFLAGHPHKRIAIVWDNAAFHKSKALRAELAHGGILGRVHLIAMPPYAPDHNPIEHVWGETKTAIANIQRTNFDQTTQTFENHITNHRFPYRI
jgi:transposase